MMSEREEHEHASRLAEIRQGRIEKAQRLRELGIDPYPTTFAHRQSIASAREQRAGEPVRVAGRVMLWRRMGGSTFGDLRDETGRLQVQLRRDVLGEERYELAKLIDIGDFVGVEGPLFTTKTGELTVEVRDLTLLGKSLLPLPEKWHGLADPELRVRKRHLAFISDPESMELFRTRSAFTHNIRVFLEREGFIEVSTPVLEAIPGGAEAEPFVTHHNALDHDFYLRISLELAHKRLIVGGFEKIYEIGRVFRNEGLGREYLQEFDLLELYWAYADLAMLRQFVERFYFTPPWPETDYSAAFREYAKFDFNAVDDRELNMKATEVDPTIPHGLGRGRLIDAIYKRLVRANLVRPQFLVNHPVDVSPLAKRDPNDATRVQRLQVLMAGSEVGNGFAELNDPIDQRARFEEQQRLREAGDREAQMLDEEFLEALEYGMPPTAGFGVGIDRWLMFLTDSATIRDVVAFPLTRPT
jgi:lysyl-tRNA synthetase class 2